MELRRQLRNRVLALAVVGFFALSGTAYGVWGEPPEPTESFAGPAVVQRELAEDWCGTERAADFTPGWFVQSRPQVKVVYAYATDQTGAQQYYRDRIQGDVKKAIAKVAEASQGRRSIAFDLRTECGPQYVDIASVGLDFPSSTYRANTDLRSRSAVIQTELRRKLGLAVDDSLGGGKRNFAVYVNLGPPTTLAQAFEARADMPGCPQGGAAPSCQPDARPGPENIANSGGFWAWVFNVPGPPFTMLHEITHTFGAVQDVALHSAMRSNWASQRGHCDFTEHDVMCPSGDRNTLCFDCGNDDYFNVSPSPGSNLATHWNVANSFFICCAPAWVWDGLGSADEDYHTSSAASSLRGARWGGVQGATGFEYAIGTTPGGTDVQNWTNTNNGVSTFVQLANVAPIAPTEGMTYYFSVRAFDAGGARSGVSTSDGITVDTRPPSSMVSQPSGAYVKSLAGGFSGTASDAMPGSGVGKVRVSLRRDADWLYWDGSGWVGGYEPWLTAAVIPSLCAPSCSPTMAWSKTEGLPSGADLPEGSYTVRSQAVDAAGLGEAPSAGKTFIVDSGPPSSAITYPTQGATVNAMSLFFHGTATDATSGVATVKASLQNANGLYWDGSAWVSEEQWLAASGTTAWSLPTPPAVSLPDGAYTVRSQAIDEAGNIERPHRFGLTFTVDSTPPVISNLSAAPPFFSPNHDGVQDTTALAFTLSEAAPYVRVTILDHEGNVVHEWLRADGKGAKEQIWNGEVRVWSGVRDGTYTYQVEAADAAGNGTPPQSSPPVVLDLKPPAVYLTGAETCCASAQPAGIGAEAHDRSGVVGVKFAYKLASASAYIDLNGGTADTTPPYTLSWGGTTLSHGASYDLRAVAVDRAGNSRASAAVTVTVTITPPAISNVSVSPDPFSPSYEVATFDYSLSEPATVWVRILGPSGGKTAPRELGPLSRPAGPSAEVWDGRDASGNVFADGTYEFAIEAVDLDGNVGRYDGTVTVQDKPFS